MPFTEIHIGDIDATIVKAAEARISKAGGVANPYVGVAVETAKSIVKKVHRDGLHFAFLDPYNLETLPFEIIRILADLKRIDMLIHVSAMDLQRNLEAYTDQDAAAFDVFAPGWRNAVDHTKASKSTVRAGILSHWSKLVEGLGFAPPRSELITGSKNQRLYWLAFISRAPITNSFWEEIRHTSGQKDFLSGL